MNKYIVTAEETDLFLSFPKYAELITCRHCENHRHRAGICDIWHAHTAPDGYCHRAKKEGSNGQ